MQNIWVKSQGEKIFQLEFWSPIKKGQLYLHSLWNDFILKQKNLNLSLCLHVPVNNLTALMLILFYDFHKATWVASIEAKNWPLTCGLKQKATKVKYGIVVSFCNWMTCDQSGWGYSLDLNNRMYTIIYLFLGNQNRLKNHWTCMFI